VLISSSQATEARYVEQASQAKAPMIAQRALPERRIIPTARKIFSTLGEH